MYKKKVNRLNMCNREREREYVEDQSEQFTYGVCMYHGSPYGWQPEGSRSFLVPRYSPHANCIRQGTPWMNTLRTRNLPIIIPHHLPPPRENDSAKTRSRTWVIDIFTAFCDCRSHDAFSVKEIVSFPVYKSGLTLRHSDKKIASRWWYISKWTSLCT